MLYAYMVVDGKVHVTPIVYVCTQCSFETMSKEEEAKHYYGVGHFLKTTYPAEKTEEWGEAKHGPLPSWFTSSHPEVTGKKKRKGGEHDHQMFRADNPRDSR